MRDMGGKSGSRFTADDRNEPCRRFSSFFVGPLGTLFFAGSNRSGVAMKDSEGKSVARKYPVSERLVMEVVGRVRPLPRRRHWRAL